MEEKEIDNLESYIPLMASATLQKAYLDTLANGNSVLEVIDNVLYEVFADGHKVKIKNVKPTIKFDITETILLK